MPVFTLTDINFNQPKGPTGPLSVLGINTKFDSSTYKYPIDLGSTDKNHYMIINILEQRKTTFENPGSGTSGNATIVNNNAAYGSVGSNTLLNNVAGLVNSARAGVGALLNAVGVSDTTFSTAINKVVTPILGSDAANATSQAISNGIQQSFNDLKNGSVRATTRISETIALYMPDTLNFDHSQVITKHPQVEDFWQALFLQELLLLIL